MDFRKFDSYVILLAIVVVAGLLVSMVARFVILAKGADTGTANLVFLIVLGICAIFYLTIIAASSSVADFIIRVFTPHMARKKRREAEAEPAEPLPNSPPRTSNGSSRKPTSGWQNNSGKKSHCSNATAS